MGRSRAAARVAVVVPCHNAARFVEEALESVVAQRGVELEIVVVDDGSTDGSAEIVESLAPEVGIVRQAQQGVSEARNVGLRATTAPYVLFHDADDRLAPGAIATGLAALADHPERGFVYGFSTQIDEAGAPRAQGEPRRVVDASYETLLSGQVPVPPSCVLFRRSAIEEVGGFRTDQALAEDLDLYLRVAQRFPIHCHGAVVAEYRWHGTNTSGRSPSRTLRAALSTLDSQWTVAAAQANLLQALDEGKRYFSEIFGEPAALEMIENLRTGDLLDAVSVFLLVFRYAPRGLLAAVHHHWNGLFGLGRAPRE